MTKKELFSLALISGLLFTASESFAKAQPKPLPLETPKPPISTYPAAQAQPDYDAEKLKASEREKDAIVLQTRGGK